MVSRSLTCCYLAEAEHCVASYSSWNDEKEQVKASKLMQEVLELAQVTNSDASCCLCYSHGSFGEFSSMLAAASSCPTSQKRGEGFPPSYRETLLALSTCLRTTMKSSLLVR